MANVGNLEQQDQNQQISSKNTNKQIKQDTKNVNNNNSNTNYDNEPAIKSNYFPDISQSQYSPTKKQPIEDEKLKFPPISQKPQNSNNELNNKKPVRYDYNDLLQSDPQSYSKKEKRQGTSMSQDSTGSKKIVKWHLWWDKPISEVRVPTYALPPKEVPSKVGSLEKINHKPGGGNVQLINEKLQWNRSARIDHLARGYKPSGGNKLILNEKLTWKKKSKIGSLENITHSPGGGNVQIIDQPFNKNGIRSRIDSGFVYEELYVPLDYQIKPSPRHSSLNTIEETVHNRRSIKY